MQPVSSQLGQFARPSGQHNPFDGEYPLSQAPQLLASLQDIQEATPSVHWLVRVTSSEYSPPMTMNCLAILDIFI